MTLESNTFDARLNAHAQRLLKTHETMLRDKTRNAAFYKALEKTIKPGDNVLDIWAGTGIWAITTAKLGASRVVAPTGIEPVFRGWEPHVLTDSRRLQELKCKNINSDFGNKVHPFMAVK